MNTGSNDWNEPLCWIYFKKHENVWNLHFVSIVNPEMAKVPGSWNCSSLKRRTCLSCMVNVVVADDLVTNKSSTNKSSTARVDWLWFNDAIWWPRSGSRNIGSNNGLLTPYGDIALGQQTLPQVLACCFAAPSHYLKQYYQRWHSTESMQFHNKCSNTKSATHVRKNTILKLPQHFKACVVTCWLHEQWMNSSTNIAWGPLMQCPPVVQAQSPADHPAKHQLIDR